MILSSPEKEKALWAGKNFAGVFKRVESTANTGMVVSGHALASQAGKRVMEQGGNAVDAAIATAFALGVVEPFMCGIGGGLLMVLRMAETKEVCIVNSEEKVPRNAKPDMFTIIPQEEASEGSDLGWESLGSEILPRVRDSANVVGYKSVAVPGMVAGVALVHQKYGILNWAEVVKPAIELAENGFAVDRYLASYIAGEMRLLCKFPEIARIFLSDGFPPTAPGTGRVSILVQPELAQTLKNIAANPDSFYTGAIAEAIARDMGEHGGIITKEDLRDFKPILIQPRPATYHDHEIIHVPGSGGTMMVQLLNILEEFNLAELVHNSDEYLHILAEAYGMTLTDTARYASGDYAQMPLDKLESKQYAAELRAKIHGGKFRPGSRPGTSVSFQRDDPGETTHFTVVDKKRNIVSCTFSVGSAFGSNIVISGTGIVMNNHMKEFNPLPGTPNSIEPGKRRWTAKNPFIVLKEGKPFLGLGSPGLNLPNLIQVFLNIAHFGMGIQEAIEAPRMGSTEEMIYSEKPYRRKEVTLDCRVPPEVCDNLRERGYKVLSLDMELDAAPFARPNGILIDPKTGRLHGGIHTIGFPFGMALGY